MPKASEPSIIKSKITINILKRIAPDIVCIGLKRQYNQQSGVSTEINESDHRKLAF